jgi:hypothetical protein
MYEMIFFVAGLLTGMFLIAWGLAESAKTKDYISGKWVVRERNNAAPSDLVVKMGDKIYTEADGTLLIGPTNKNGGAIVIIQEVKKAK